MSKASRVQKVVIVGGGTSAWLTAAMLSYKKPQYEIIVVDKEVGTPIGVGEGTILGFANTMFDCGFDIQDWFFELESVYKSGILFPGWTDDNPNIWHPFLHPQYPGAPFSYFDLWSKNQDLDFKDHGLALYDVSVNHNKIDKDNLLFYAYHVNCGKLVLFLQERIVGIRNVKSINSEVVDIQRENNNIHKLILKNGQEITGDLFIDCTGFKGLLNDSPDRVTLENRLWCDTAVAGPVQYIDKDKEMHPYVVNEAVDHGWLWKIPVQSRIGSGLVFNRSITSVDEAKEYLCKYWNNRITPDQLRVIDWTPFYNKNMWHDNVVSIGLSAGFIEPLESTGIALITKGIYEMLDKLEQDFYTAHDIELFNARLAVSFEESIDFVSMHYMATEKNTPFWNWVKETRFKSDTQKIYEDKLKDFWLLPFQGRGSIFSGYNWFCLLIQLGYPVESKNLDPLTIQQINILLTRHKNSELNKPDAVLQTEYIEALKNGTEQFFVLPEHRPKGKSNE
jgi:tryptophan halogenase